MRIRSGHILLAVGALICAAVVLVLLQGGDTQAAREAGVDTTASLPPAGADMSEGPRIEVETIQKDMGIVSNKEHTRKPFRIKNVGHAPLQIREIKTSCACTQAKVPEGGISIPPLNEATFDIEIDPNRIPGFEAHKVLTVMSNDPLKPQVDIGVTSHVDPEFSIEPETFAFGDVKKGEAPTAKVLLRQLRDEPVELKEMNTFGLSKADSDIGNEYHAMTDSFSFGVVKRPETEWTKPGKAEYELSVTLTSNIAAGSLEGKRVFVMTNILRMPAFPIELTGKVIAPYSLSPTPPQKLNVKADKITGGYTPAFATVTADRAVTIEDITPKTPAVSASVEPGITANEARLRVTLSEAAPAGPLEDEVRFNVVIDGQKYPERVGVRGYGFKKPAAAQ